VKYKWSKRIGRGLVESMGRLLVLRREGGGRRRWVGGRVRVRKKERKEREGVRRGRGVRERSKGGLLS